MAVNCTGLAGWVKRASVSAVAGRGFNPRSSQYQKHAKCIHVCCSVPGLAFSIVRTGQELVGSVSRSCINSISIVGFVYFIKGSG